MIPVGGKPLMKVLLENLEEAGISEALIVVPGDSRGAGVRSYFKDYDRIKVDFVIQQTPGGTAEALNLCKEKITGDFLLLYGGILTFPDSLEKMAQSPAPSIALLGERVGRRIGAKVEGDVIKSFALHPRWEGEISADYPLAGIFHLSRDILERLDFNPGVFDRTPPGIPPLEEFELSATLQGMAQDMEVKGVFLPSVCIELDNPVNILDARDAYLAWLVSRQSEPEIHETAIIETKYQGDIRKMGEGSVIEEGVRVTGFLSMGRNSKILQGTYLLGPCIIGDNCVIGPYAYIYNADIGNGVHLGHCTEFTGVAMDGAYCTHYSYISGVLGRKCNLGAATVCGTLRHDDRPVPVYVDSNRVETTRRGLGAFFGDYCRTGVNTVILPGRMIGPRSVVDAGVVVDRNVPADKYLKLKQSSELLDWKFPVV
jgi:bifunctional UDP-N-acetylglucosamine pyrophosphorylase/glucosamine-1-phosphate N-acetyltransferase